jgi:SAM-dependent methyltransferase
VERAPRPTGREAFDEAASLYDEVRPGYPDDVVDAVLAFANLPPGAAVLEVGCGTGQMTLPLARRGLAILALEPGAALAALAARNCAGHAGVRVLPTTLEAWAVEAAAFDLAVSAQAFHWIAPGPGCAILARALRRGGAIALAWYIDVSEHTDFWRATEPLYDTYFPSSPGGGAPTLRDHLDRHRQALRDSPAFEGLHEVRLDWRRTYSGGDYLKLLQTYSDRARLAPADYARFLADMARVIEKSGGSVTREYETVVLLARRT